MGINKLLCLTEVNPTDSWQSYAVDLQFEVCTP